MTNSFEITGSNITNLSGSGNIYYQAGSSSITDSSKLNSETNFSRKTILLLAANPRGTSPLRLDEEVREIEEGLKRSLQRDHLVLQPRWAVRPRDVQRALLECKPQIVHFSGHGAAEEGLVLENDTGNWQLVSAAAIAQLFSLFANHIECVLLNACYSEIQAKALAQHIPFVIGMPDAIGDRAAIEFAIGFYDAIGAGESIEFAYHLGCAAIAMADIQTPTSPILLKK